MYLMKVPSRSSPTAASISPDRKVASSVPSTPCWATVAATSTIKAPAGPPIWNRLPPKAETMKPPTIEEYSPRSGVTPDEIATARESVHAPLAPVRPDTEERKTGVSRQERED